MNGFLGQYKTYQNEFEDALKAFCKGFCFQPEILREAMRYSLLNGGKRLRPVLFMSTLDMYRRDHQSEQQFALALECVHTYSLIHDDLPALDNDDFRRGKPSCHKQFGEANAILAGDALLSLAFDLVISSAGKSAAHAKAAAEFSKASGADGMLAGQAADIYYERKTADEAELDFIYRNKTGKLLTAPVVMAGMLAGGEIEKLRAFGQAFGYLFQLTDDLLDVKGSSEKVGKTLGKDIAEEKLTCVKVFGMEKSERLVEEYAAKCKGILSELGDANPQFLSDMTDFIVQRSF